MLAFVVIAPYIAREEWRANFGPPALHDTLNTTWFSAFQVVSSYTNTGMSLVDTSMVPFQKAYPMIFFMIILILAGNTAFVSVLMRRANLYLYTNHSLSCKSDIKLSN